MMASSSRRKNPIEMILTPYCSAGTVPSTVGLGSVCTFIRVGIVGPYTSASMIPTRAPVLASARARLAETVDFPTPPLPLATGITFFTDGMSRSLIGPGDPRTRAVIVTSTPPTPGRAATASRASCRMRSRTGQAGVVSSMVNPTVPSDTRTSFTNPKDTMSRPRSGSVTTRRASRTWLSLTCDVSAPRLFREVYWRIIDDAVGAVVVREDFHDFRVGQPVPRHRRLASSASRRKHERGHEHHSAHTVSLRSPAPFAERGSGGEVATRVIRRRALGQPIPKRPGAQRQAPLLEDRQCHRAHAALRRSRGPALLEQPRLELIRVWICGDGAVEQIALDGEPDHIGRRIALATLPPAFRSFESGEQLTADLGRSWRCHTSTTFSSRA